MVERSDPRSAETALLAQLAAVERRIGDLQDEKHALERLIARVRGQHVASSEVTRKNSVKKILIEKIIIDKLNSSKKPIATADIYTHVKSLVFTLNENTFRSHLHRLKNRGMIVNGADRASWTSAPPRKPS